MKKHWLKIIMGVCLATTLPQFASAQLLPVNTTQSLSILLTPAYPKVNQTVTARLESSAVDLSQAEIAWYLNGTLRNKGQGEKALRFRTGRLGEKTEIAVTILPNFGASLQKTLTVRPAEVDLHYEAESYTPPFYRGKALYSFQGRVRVVALPSFVDANGERVPNGDLNFSWSQNGNPLPRESGVGKNVFIVEDKGGLIRPAFVSVEVSTLSKDLIASAEIALAPGAPSVIIYENHPLLGILWNRALSENFTLSEKEVRLVAVPYFFSASGQSDRALSFSWQMNGETLSGERTNNVVFRNEEGVEGEALVGVEVGNAKSIYQSAVASSRIFFKAVTSDFLADPDNTEAFPSIR